MRLSAKMLKNVSNVNHFQYSATAFLSEGSANEVYFQLVDLDKVYYPGMDTSELPHNPIRYMPITGSTVSVIFDSLFDDVEITLAATQPFAQDPSIWKVALAVGEIPASGNFIFVLAEGASIKRAVVKNALNVSLNEVGSC